MTSLDSVHRRKWQNMWEEIPNTFINIYPINETSKRRFVNSKKKRNFVSLLKKKISEERCFQIAGQQQKELWQSRSIIRKKKQDPMPFSILLAGKEQIVRKSLAGLLNLVRGNYHLNLCSMKEQEIGTSCWKFCNCFSCALQDLDRSIDESCLKRQ